MDDSFLPADQFRPRADPQFDTGNSPLDTLANLFAPPLNRSAMDRGLVPGQFSPTQNLFDRANGMQANASMRAVMALAAKEDRDAYMRLAHGISNVAGSPWGAEQQKAAGLLADDVASAGPILAQMSPMMFDRLHGSRGSAQVMAMGVFDAGRFLRNSKTGEMGLSQQETSSLNSSLFHNLFSGGNLSATSGFGAGQVGSMFDQMARRGGVGGNTDTGQVTSRIKEMSKAVRAMQDIFGEAGQTDAPMQSIFDALEKITQGGLSTMSPARVANMVNTMHALAHQTGVSVETMAAMGSQGGQAAMSVGLNRQFGGQAAMSAVAFGSAFGGMVGPTGFGGLNKDEATSLDQRLRISAAASAQGNALSAVANMAEQGLLTGIDTSTDAGKAKLQTLLNQTAGMSRDQISQTLQQNFRGLDSSTISRFMASSGANQGAGLRAGVADIVRGQQFHEVDKVMENALASGASSGLAKAGAGGATGVGQALREALQSMDPALLSDPDKIPQRNQVLTAALRRKVHGLTEDQAKQIVASAMASLDERVNKDPALSQFGNVAGLVGMNRGDVLAQGGRNTAAAKRAAAAMEKLGGVNQQDFIRRFSDALQAAADPAHADLGEIAAKALGAGATAADVRKRLGPDADKILKDIAAQVGGKVPPQDEKKPVAASDSPKASGGQGGMPGKIEISGTLDLHDGSVKGTGAPGSVPPPGGK